MNHIIFKVTIFSIITIFIPLSCFADTQKIPKESVSQLLKKVKQSQGDERRKAMNALKLKLRTVNAATRAKTMQELRQAFAAVQIQPGTTTHSLQQIPQQQMQQKLNQPSVIPPHQSNPGITTPPVQRPEVPSQPRMPSPGGHP